MQHSNQLAEMATTSEKMTSLQIAEVTGKEHKNVMRDIRNLLDQLDEKDVLNYELISFSDSYGRQQQAYSLTKKGSLCLASGYNANLRMKIINRWEELESKQQFQIPQTYAEALMLAAKQAEELEVKNKELSEARPKVEFYDAVTGSSDTIDMREVAGILNMGVGRNKIFAILRDLKILDRKNTPYQSYIDRGYFRTIESSYTKPDGTTCINIKTVIFQKGLDFIRKTINKHISDK